MNLCPRFPAFRRLPALPLILFLLLAPVASAQVSTEYYHPPFNLFTPQQDVQLGRQAETQALKKLPILHNRADEDYLTRLGLKLAAQMPGPRFPYRFHIVRQKQINAFALPGGPVFVNAGAICAARDEAQLAGVLGHEESHVALRHSTSMASKKEAGGLVLGILGSVFGGGSAGQIAQLGTAIGANFLFLKYSRTMESQADALGAQVMNSAGYNPVELARFFQIIEEQGGPAPAQFLSDHPNPGNRMAAIEKEIPTFGPHPPYVDNSPRFVEFQHRLCTQNGVAAMSSAAPRPSSLEPSGDSSRPDSGPWTTTLFQGLRIGVPDGWSQSGGGNSPQLSLVAPHGLSLAGGQSSVLTGVIAGVFTPSGGSTLAAHSRQLVASLRSTNPQLRILASPLRVTLDGITGQSLFLENRNARGEPERDRLVTFPRQDGSVLYFLFIAPAREYSRYASTFDRIFASVTIAGS